MAIYLVDQFQNHGNVGIYTALVAFLVISIIHIACTWFRQSHIPGPLLCSISNLPRLLWVRTGKAHLVHIELHDKYGYLVRLGPNSISVGDAREVSKIYGVTANLRKSDFYKVLQPMQKGKIVQGLFNTQDENLHRALKKPIAGIYSMSNLVGFEQYVDSTMNYFFRRLEEEHDIAHQSCNLSNWLQWFAFDVMGEITFSKRLGFLENAHDVDNIISDIATTFERICWVGQMPWLDKLWAKNTIINKMLPAKTAPMITFALARAAERADQGNTEFLNSRDFMSRFLEVQRKDTSIPDGFLTAWTTSNISAGSDTTAITLRSIVYYLLKSPESMTKLTNELRQARKEGRLSSIVTWKESQRLEYLDACVKEAGRLHPAVGLVMERVVPPGGMEICGKHFKAGTVIGMNPWVVHRDKHVFGQDAYEWNPDRWLCEKSQRQLMERSLLTFGQGHRSCIGKNISYLEIYKLIPTMFARYEMEFATPTTDWNTSNHWLVTQTGLEVKLQRRPEYGQGIV